VVISYKHNRAVAEAVVAKDWRKSAETLAAEKTLRWQDLSTPTVDYTHWHRFYGTHWSPLVWPVSSAHVRM